MDELQYPVTIFFSEKDRGYIALAPDLKGCSAFGDTPQEALMELETAIELWLAVAHQDATPIPEPTRMSA
jgi:predicted RNase H-like HicB family nuclease